jgi:hypothetical protein
MRQKKASPGSTIFTSKGGSDLIRLAMTQTDSYFSSVFVVELWNYAKISMT